jgi:pyruvate,orthophosphate dikinase
MDAPLLLTFHDGNRSMADLLGGKGANLAEMTRLGLPVPHGFTVTTEACRAYLRTGQVSPALDGLVTDAVRRLEAESGRRFGDPADPLLVSVRSGARFSMPGMMETVLNVGLNDTSLPGLVARAGERFAWDCYRRLVQMYGRTVLGIDPQLFEDRLDEARRETGAADDTALSAGVLKDLVGEFRTLLVTRSGEDLPHDPRTQLDRAIRAVFESWDGDRARTYRRHEHIADDLGTAVNVVEMVYGNTGPSSGSGVCFTRDPATGAPGAYGDYLPNAQGEDVVNGSRATIPLRELGELQPRAFAELQVHLHTLETHYRDLCDVEFTIEDGRLWILQTRVGKRSGAAAFRIACALADEGVIDLDEALVRVEGHQLETLLHPRFEDTGDRTPLASGLPASPGASVGAAVFDPARAVELAGRGTSVVLVRTETSPDDLDGMIAATAVVTAKGGLTSHAAVVARGLGRTCVTSVAGLVVEPERRRAHLADGTEVREGTMLSVDGTSGHVYLGRLAVRPSAVESALGLPQEAVQADPTAVAVRRLLAHADERRRTGVRANAETADEAREARRLGAQGIGLARTEHMLLGTRRELVERVILDDRRAEALAEIERLAHADLTELLLAMDGLPVVVRLLDPPLHEFLPDVVKLSTRVAYEEGRTGRVEQRLRQRLEAVRRWQEANPMLGLRGVRLLTVVPELVDAHVRALVRAALALQASGHTPRPEVMVPLVADHRELEVARARILEAVASVPGAEDLDLPVGVMIELPRAALTAGSLARSAAFFSFGTNDLTQTTWGISRDDAESSFLTAYREQGLLEADPFTTIDVEGVGELVTTAAERGRAANPGLGLGVCGEHGGDPASVRFFADLGVDYVSCSPPRVPIARLEAGRAAVLASATTAATSDTR